MNPISVSEASIEKVEKYLFAEYPNLRDKLELLEGKKTSQTTDSLAELWGVPLADANDIVDKISKAGVGKIEEMHTLPLHARRWTPELKSIFKTAIDHSFLNYTKHT